MMILYFAFVFVISSLGALISLCPMAIVLYILAMMGIGMFFKWAESLVKN